jgi:cytochrome c oxidase assembly protein subunit 11
MDRRRLQRRNRFIVAGLAGVVVGMVGMAYAAVPLYSLFCRVTGFGGTTQRAEAPGASVGARTVTVRFNADTSADMPWDFAPEQVSMRMHVGEERLAFFSAHNRTSKPIVGTATFNVTPFKAGPYFVKVECFCFTEQRLEPGQQVDMPVSFFVDPTIAEDPNLDDVDTITLSYTFFRAEAASAARVETDQRRASGIE